MSANFDPYSPAQEIKIGEVLKKRIVILGYSIIPGHTKPGGKLGYKEDYIKRHIDILIEFENQERIIKSDSLNFEKQLMKVKEKLPAETEIFGSKHGMWFSSVQHVRGQVNKKKTESDEPQGIKMMKSLAQIDESNEPRNDDDTN
jgi:hypothetical protein